MYVMKKNQLAATCETTTETLQRESRRKKNRDGLILNLILLHKEFHALGLPDALMNIVVKELGKLTGEEYVLDFGMQVGGLPVKGRVHLEADFPEDLYTTTHYELVLEGSSNTGDIRSAFLCTPFYFISVEEAVNLLQNRCIYRQPEVDPLGEGCWVFLGGAETMPGFPRLLFLHNGFQVRENLLVSGLGSWLGPVQWNKLVSDLEKGYQCELTAVTDEGMRKVKVEADPFGQRLKVTDMKGVEVKL